MVITRRAATIAVTGVLVVAACGATDGAPPPAARAPAAEVAPASTTIATTTTVIIDPTATTEATATTGTSGPTSLPGEAFDPVFTPAGAVLAAVGVAFDETLTVRALPGFDRPEIASFSPLVDGLVSEGRAQRVDSDVWLEVTAREVTGWTPLRRLVYLGAARDQTPAIVAAIGDVPTAPSMLELGTIVTDALVPSDASAPPAEIVVAVEPIPEATSEIVYDTFPGEFFGSDDSIGTRYVVTGRQTIGDPLPVTGFSAGLVYELVRVDAITFCTRGVTQDGLCI